MTLKTLKEVIGMWMISQGEDSPNVALQKMFQQEVIKHIKAIRKDTHYNLKNSLIVFGNQGKEDWIKDFFNITDDELK